MGKGVEYIGFSHKPSLAMVANCSKSRLLTSEDILKFLKTDSNMQKKSCESINASQESLEIEL
jgi:hypothetical protein